MKTKKKIHRPKLPGISPTAGFWERWVAGAKYLYTAYNPTHGDFIGGFVGAILVFCWVWLIPYAYFGVFADGV